MIQQWDTANVYSNGESERLIGKAMKIYGIPRRKLVIMTKCCRVICDQENYDVGSAVNMHENVANQSKDYVNQKGIGVPALLLIYLLQHSFTDHHLGLSRGAILEAVDASLERLGTTYIDVLQVHRYDPNVPPEETMRALDDLVRCGKVRYLGASSMWAHEFAILQHTAEKYGLTKFISMQNHYNLIYREEEREMNRYCKLTGVGLIPVRRFLVFTPIVCVLIYC